MKLLSRIKKIDIFGRSIELRLDKKKVHKTYCGAAMTLVIFMITIAIVYIYFNQYTQYDNPFLRIYELPLKEPLLFNSDAEYSSNFKFALEDKFTSNSLDSNSFIVKAQLVSSSSSSSDFQENNVSFEVCEDDNSAYCLSQITKIYLYPHNPLNQDSLNYLEFLVYDCSTYQQLYGSTNSSCLNSSLWNSPKLTLQFVENSVIPKIYHEPISSENHKLEVDLYEKSEITLHFKQLMVQTDEGIVWESMKSIQVTTFQSATYSSPQSSQSSPLVKIKILLDPKVQYIERTYSKIQVYFAYVGGILKMVAVLGEFFTRPFVQLSLNTKMINEVFDFEGEDNEVGQGSSVLEEFHEGSSLPSPVFKKRGLSMQSLKLRMSNHAIENPSGSHHPSQQYFGDQISTDLPLIKIFKSNLPMDSTTENSDKLRSKTLQNLHFPKQSFQVMKRSASSNTKIRKGSAQIYSCQQQNLNSFQSDQNLRGSDQPISQHVFQNTVVLEKITEQTIPISPGRMNDAQNKYKLSFANSNHNYQVTRNQNTSIKESQSSDDSSRNNSLPDISSHTLTPRRTDLRSFNHHISPQIQKTEKNIIPFSTVTSISMKNDCLTSQMKSTKECKYFDLNQTIPQLFQRNEISLLKLNKVESLVPSIQNIIEFKRDRLQKNSQEQRNQLVINSQRSSCNQLHSPELQKNRLNSFPILESNKKKSILKKANDSPPKNMESSFLTPEKESPDKNGKENKFKFPLFKSFEPSNNMLSVESHHNVKNIEEENSVARNENISPETVLDGVQRMRNSMVYSRTFLIPSDGKGNTSPLKSHIYSTKDKQKIVAATEIMNNYQNNLQTPENNLKNYKKLISTSKKTKNADSIFKRLFSQGKTLKIRFHEYFLYYLQCFSSLYSEKKKQLLFSKKQVKERLDVVYIIQKLVEIDKLKILLLDEDQLKLFEYLPKPIVHIRSKDQNYNSSLFGKQIEVKQSQGPQNMQEAWSMLHQQKKPVQKATEASRVYKKMMEMNEKDLSKIDRKLIGMLDTRIKDIFEVNNEIQKQQQQQQHLKKVKLFDTNHQSGTLDQLSKFNDDSQAIFTDHHNHFKTIQNKGEAIGSKQFVDHFEPKLDDNKRMKKNLFENQNCSIQNENSLNFNIYEDHSPFNKQE